MPVSIFYFNGTVTSTNWTNPSNAADGDVDTLATASASTAPLEVSGTNATGTGVITQVRCRAYIGTGGTGPVTFDPFWTTEDLGNFDTTNFGTLSVPTGGWTWAKVAALKAVAQSASVQANDTIARLEVEVTHGPFVNNFWGAETGGLEELNSVTGTITADNTTVHGSGAYSYLLNSTNAVAVLNPFESVADAGNGYLYGFWAYFSGSSEGLEVYIRDSSANIIISVAFNWTGPNVALFRDGQNAGTGTILGSSTSYTTGQWYFVEVYFNDTTGAYEWWLDGTSIASGTTTFTYSGPFDMVMDCNGVSPNLDDLYFASGATSASDRLGGCEVKSYRSNVSTATSDFITGATGTLTTSNWANAQEIPFSETNIAQYAISNDKGGGIYTDDLGGSSAGGPNGDSNITGTIPAAKYIWRLARGNGSGTTHSVKYGNNGETVSSTDVSLSSGYGLFFEVSESATVVPTTSEYLAIGFAKSSGGRDIYCSDMLAQVLHVPATTTNRDVTCTTETLDITKNNATVTTNVPRNVTGTTETLDITKNNATVFRAKLISGITETLDLTSTNAAVAANRQVNGVTEALTLTDNDATVATNVPRVVTGATETLSLTDSNATVQITIIRNITGVTESLTLTDNNATVLFQRTVGGATETLTLTNNNATVTKTKQVTGASETLTLVNVNASINATRGAIGTTEVLSLANTNALLNTARNTLGTTETLALTEANAAISFDRSVVGVTEVLTITDNDATVDAAQPRNVVCTTEVLDLTVQNASANLGRRATAATEILNSTTQNASINSSRNAIAASELLDLTIQTAAVGFDRQVTGAVETLNLTVQAGTVIRGTAIVGTTEALNISVSNASINSTRTVLSQVEALNIAATPAGVNETRIVTTTVELVALVDNNAIVTASRIVIASSETLVLTNTNASLGQGLVVTGTTETLQLTNTTAIVNGVRGVVGTSEQLTATVSNANVNNARGVNGLSDTLTLVAQNAVVSTSSNRDVTALVESLTLANAAASVNKSRNAVSSSELLQLVASAANVVSGLLVSAAPQTLVLTNTAAAINATKNTLTATEVLLITAPQGQVIQGIFDYGTLPPGSLIWVRPSAEELIWG